MKRFIYTLALSLLPVLVAAQVPAMFNYQGAARDNTGAVLANQTIGIRILIREDSPSGTIVYSETHSPVTNDFGIFNLQIGAGNVISGDMQTIDWGANNYFFEVEMDASGGSNYQSMGASQLVAVPYAMYARNVENDKVNDADADPNNEIQALSFSNDTLYLSNGGMVYLGGLIDDADADPNNEIQALSFSNDTLYLSNGGSVYLGGLIDDADADPNNELQVLSISNDTIFLSNGGMAKLPEGATIWMKNGNTVYPGSAQYMAVGMDSALYPVHIKADSVNGLVGFSNQTNGNLDWHLRLQGPNNDLGFTETGVADNRLVLEKGGNIGIGVADPEESLDINGNIKLSGTIVQNSKYNCILYNNWLNYNNGYAPCQLYMDKEGVVHITGLISGGYTGAGNQILYIPYPNMRPNNRRIFQVLNWDSNNGKAIRVDVHPSGWVTIESSGVNSLWINLDISYRPD